MTVTLTSEALGKAVGATHTGPEEAWLLAEGYASQAGYATDTSAVLTGSSNAVNIVTGGNLVLDVGSVEFTIALAAADTPAAAATKIDTALTGKADAAIVSSKLVVTSVATGAVAVIKVVSGTGTVLANLGLTAGTVVAGSDGGVGVSNTGLSASSVANDLTSAANREPAPSVDPLTGVPDSGPRDPAMLFTDPAKPAYDFDAGAVDLEAPSVFTVKPTALKLAGGAVTAEGQNFTGTTGVTVGGTAATAVTVVDDSTLKFTAPAKAAGTYDVVVTDNVGTRTLTGGLTYAA